MFKKVTIIGIVLVISLFVLGAVAVYAQGRGNGPGGAGGNQPDTPGTGLNTQQRDNAYSSNVDGQQRGRMNRGGTGSTGNNGQNGANNARGTGIYSSLPPASADELPQEVIDLMIAGWLDEQHAYAAYESIMTQFGEIAPFVNIQRAEVQHAATWEFLFERYGIPTPAIPDFDIPMFDSPQEACALGAEAEIANFTLYDEMLAAFAPYPDIYQAAVALRDASEFNHLPAFQACAAS